MPHRLLVLLPALLLAACSGGAPSSASPTFLLRFATASPSPAATPTLGTPSPSPAPAGASPTISVTSSPTASPSPMPAPTRPTPVPTPRATPTATASPSPTAEPSPGESEDPSTSTSRGLLIETLLTAEELPVDLEAGRLEESDSVNDPAFAVNNGLRVVRTVWQGSGQGEVLALFDYRYQFPHEDDAATFLEEAKVFLSESDNGLAEAGDPEVGELGYLFTGEVDGLDNYNYNVIFRVGNIVAKIWVNVPSTQEPDVAVGVARTAAARLTRALGLGPFPNEDEVEILAVVPTDIRPSCHRADPIYRDEIDTITCDGSAEHPPIDYTLFRTAAALDGAFERDLARADPMPTADGRCDAGNYVAPYSIAGAESGRIMCFPSIDDTGREFKVIEWTNTERRMLAFMASTTRTWEDLIAFWRDDAGPII